MNHTKCATSLPSCWLTIFLFLRTDWSSPLDLRRGWLLYGGIGVIGAAAAVVAVSTLAVTVTGQPPPREVCFLGLS
jgi:hypothetical protein